jgi:hypothetical protein
MASLRDLQGIFYRKGAETQRNRKGCLSYEITEKGSGKYLLIRFPNEIFAAPNNLSGGIPVDGNQLTVTEATVNFLAVSFRRE